MNLRLWPLALPLILTACSSKTAETEAIHTEDGGAGDVLVSDSSAGNDVQGDVSEEAADVAPDSSKDAVVDSKEEASKDAAVEVADAASESSTCTIQPGLGKVSCLCGKPNEVEWKATSSPFYFEGRVDFGTAGWDATQLTADGKTINNTPNLGGKSVKSEVVAFEMLARCDFAKLIKSESQINYYNVGGKKTDILVQINGRKIGVSVVRAHNYYDSGPYSSYDAQYILEKKLNDIPLSAANAVDEDAWERSMLAVIADDQATADVVKSTWEGLSADLRSNVILFVTVTDGYDYEVYYDK